MAKTGSVSDGRFRADVTIRVGSVAIELHGDSSYRVYPVPLFAGDVDGGSGRVAALDRALFGGGDDLDSYRDAIGARDAGR